MRYAEHRVSPRLADRIECVWFAEDPGARAGQRERVLPDGCIEWIFHLGSPYVDGSGRRQPASFVVGPSARPLTIEASGPVATLGVRFRPGGARGLMPPLSRFANAFPTPREIWESEAGPVEDEVLSAPDTRSRIAVLEAFLAKRRDRSRAEAPRLARAVGLVLSSRGRAPISRVARAVGCSPRQLEREFAAGVGLSPKELARIVRFQNLLRVAGRLQPGAGWADLAARCGYADQAHLVREFKGFSGVTPTSRPETEGALARYFIDPARLDALLGAGAGVASRQPDPRPVAFVQDRAAAGD